MKLFIVCIAAKMTLSLLALTLLSGPAYAGVCSHKEGSFKCVDFIRNYDGDTFVVDIPRVHSFFGSQISIRIRGIDTGEIKNHAGRTECEYEMAHLAKNELERLFEKSNEIELRNTERGKYFRVLADVYINGRSVANHMLRKKLAIEYDGGTRGGADWRKLKTEADKFFNKGREEE